MTATADLLARIRDGDRRAADDLVRRFESQLRGFFDRRIGGSTMGDLSVEDLMQETQLQAVRSLPTFTYRVPGSYLAWLYTIARRVLARTFERAGRQPPVGRIARPDTHGMTTADVLAALAAPDTDPLDRVERMRRLEILAEALSELDERRREAIVLRYVAGLTSAEAAAQLGISDGSLRVLLSRGRRQLVDVLDRMLA